MNNQIKIIREKLELLDKIITKELLDKLLNKFAPSYKIKDISSLKLISPLKRWKYYINNINKQFENPYEMIKKYFEGEKYVFWWLGIYNMYWFSTQVAEWHTVYNTKISWNRIIWKTKFIFRKQRESFFYGNVINKNWDNKYNVMSEQRAFIQIIKEWQKVKNIPYNVNKDSLLQLAEKYSSKNIVSKIKQICI